MGGRGGTSARARESGGVRVVSQPASQVAARDGMRRKAKRALRKFERKKDGENARVPSRSVGLGLWAVSQSGSQSRF